LRLAPEKSTPFTTAEVKSALAKLEFIAYDCSKGEQSAGRVLRTCIGPKDLPKWHAHTIHW
jgi:hypothetical protein